MAEEKKVLDLDEALGEKQTVKVKRKEQEYELRDIGSFSAYQLLRIQGMRRKVANLQSADEVTEEQAQEIEKLFDYILCMLSEKLPVAEMTYSEKTTVIAFYFMEVRKKKAPMTQA